MWGVLNSSQVLILTFEFSSPWPHHLMPLVLDSYPPPPPPPPLSLLSCLSSPPSVPSSASIPSVSPLHYISASAHCRCPPFPLCPLSQVSDRPISAPMIVVGVLAWQLSQWWQECAQPGSKRCLYSCSRTRLTQWPILRDRQEISLPPPAVSFAPLLSPSPTVHTRHFGNCLPNNNNNYFFNIRKARSMMDGRWGYGEIGSVSLNPWYQIILHLILIM